MANYDSKVFNGERMAQLMGNVKDEFSYMVHFGECSNSSGATSLACYVGSAANDATFQLSRKPVVAIKFAADVGASATLNINGTGAKAIKLKGAAITASDIKAGDNVFLKYNGTNYDIIIDNVTNRYAGSVAGAKQDKITFGTATSGTVTTVAAGTNVSIGISGSTATISSTVTPAKMGQGYTTCSTSSGTILVADLTNYELITGGVIGIKFQYAVASNATLNINGKGDKAIKFKGSNISIGTIEAGDICTLMYDGSSYELLAIHREVATADKAGILKVDTSLTTEELALYSDSVSAVYQKKLLLRKATNTYEGVTKIYNIYDQNSSSKTDGAPTVNLVTQNFAPKNGSSSNNFYATTATAGDHSNLVATTDFVTTAINNAQAGAAMFQGSVGGTNDTIKKDADTPGTGEKNFRDLTDYKKGWYWVVAVAGTYCGTDAQGTGGYSCEAGDFIFCVKDYSSSYSANDFSVVQNNLDFITETEVNTLWSAVFTPST